MDKLRTRLPPVAALIAFEAAGRLLGFTAAARELGITQAGISRHIKLLEADLGAPLFRRLHRSVRLTREGERLHQAVTGGLAQIAAVAESVRRKAQPNRVSIASTIAFTSLWLLPRLPRLHVANPEIELRLVAVDTLPDLEAEGIDLLIRYGDHGRWPRVETKLLLSEEIFPVCGPGYRFRKSKPQRPADLLGESFLHMEPIEPSWIGWRDWFLRVGEEPAQLAGPQFNNYSILLQAAAAGEGIALGWGRIVEGLIREGQLVRVLSESVAADGGYYLATPAGSEPSPAVQALSRWLLAEAADER